MSKLDDAMATLNDQWYNAITTGIGLDPHNFQLFQGNSPLGTTSAGLWNRIDAIPPKSLTHFYDPSQRNNFSQDYGAVLSNLTTPADAKVQKALGDSYVDWVEYKKHYTGSMPKGGLPALFKQWCELKGPGASRCTQAYEALLGDKLNPVAQAQEAFIAAQAAGKGFAYNQTYEDLQNKLPSGGSKRAEMDSATESKDVTHTWAQASLGGAFRFFWGDASGSYDSLSINIVTAGLKINCSFERQVTFAMGPLAKPDPTDPVLKDYQPWYNSAALHTAYTTNNNTVWGHGSPSWDDTFGPDGNMLRAASALVIVDGINMTLSSSAKLSESDQKTFKAAAEGGYWPFFKAQGSGGWSHSYSFNDSGQVKVTSSSPKGNPQVLGVLVTPAPDYIGD